MTSDTIPTVDLTAFDTEGPDRDAAARDIARAFGDFGLVYLTGHGVQQDQVGQLYDAFGAFTKRSDAEKEKLSTGHIWYQRGWTPPNTEKAVVAGGQPDFKECFFAAPEETDAALKTQYPEIFADNVWPDDSGPFAELYMAVGQQLHAAGEKLLVGCALALGLDASELKRRVQGGPHVTRLLRYLPLTAEHVAQKVLWGEEHTDFNLVTLLPGGRFHDPDGQACDRPDDGSGLYLRARPDQHNPDGRKVRGVAPKGCIVAQVGQQLEVLTGGRFLATPHIITAPDTPGYSRFSGAHFVHLHSHELVFPLEKFRDEEAMAAYRPPVLAGTYSIKTLVDIGLAPKQALDGLGYKHYSRLADTRARET